MEFFLFDSTAAPVSLKLALFKDLTNDPYQPLWSTQFPHLLLPCISNQNITPGKKNGDDESLQQCTVGGEGWQEGVGEKEGEGAASHSYSSSVFGASAGCSCRSPSSCLLSPTLLLPFLPAFSRPPSPTPPSPSCLSHSPRGLIYGCAAPETGMTTHAFLCFVSSLACWLALWLTACTWCVFTLYSFHAVSVLPQSKNVSLFLFVLFIVVKQCVSPATALNKEHISSMQKLYFGTVSTYTYV